MNEVHHIEQVLADSLEDFSISRENSPELELLIQEIGEQPAVKTKVRKLAFRLCTKAINEIGELAAMDWLESVIKMLYVKKD